MPLYDYYCKNCGKNFEIQHKMAESAPPAGPGCAQANCSLEKQISLVAGTVRSPNPFVSQNGGPAFGGRNTTSSDSRMANKKEEKSHSCAPTCALHSH